jgi:PPOX class probable F420-dependent enzyme
LEAALIDFSSAIGQKILRRLRDEEVVWLTTVDSSQRPQPRPVWFHWNGETLLILSQAQAAKNRHIARNPAIALNFNTDEFGGDVAVVLGLAQITPPPPDERYQAYFQKYQAGIRDLGSTFEQLRTDYPVAILITPTDIRGF